MKLSAITEQKREKLKLQVAKAAKIWEPKVPKKRQVERSKEEIAFLTFKSSSEFLSSSLQEAKSQAESIKKQSGIQGELTILTI